MTGSLFDDAMMGIPLAKAVFRGMGKLGKAACKVGKQVYDSGVIQETATNVGRKISELDLHIPACPQCGSKLIPGVKFCPKCGAKVPERKNTVDEEAEETQGCWDDENQNRTSARMTGVLRSVTRPINSRAVDTNIDSSQPRSAVPYQSADNGICEELEDPEEDVFADLEVVIVEAPQSDYQEDDREYEEREEYSLEYQLMLEEEEERRAEEEEEQRRAYLERQRQEELERFIIMEEEANWEL